MGFSLSQFLLRISEERPQNIRVTQCITAEIHLNVLNGWGTRAARLDGEMSGSAEETREDDTTEEWKESGGKGVYNYLNAHDYVH